MATRVTITKALEAKIRQLLVESNPRKFIEVIKEVIDKLDDEQGKREAGSKESEAKSGLGYKELVSLFRSHLGDSLLTPPKPGTVFIIKTVNKAKEQGIDITNVEQAVRGLRRTVRGPVRLADLVWNYDRYYSDGASGDSGPETEEAEALVHSERNVFTGRP